MAVFDPFLNKIRKQDIGVVPPVSGVSLQNWAWDPNTLWTIPTWAGGEFRDTLTGKKYYAQSAVAWSWVEINYTI